MAMALRHRKGT